MERNSGSVRRPHFALLALLALPALTACQATAELRPEPDFASLIVFLGTDARSEVRAIDLIASSEPLPFVSLPAEAIALLYRDSLSTMSIERGSLERAGDGRGRALPLPDEIRAFDGQWAKVTELPPPVKAFRFRTLSLEECAQLGRCIASLEDPVCLLECPTPDEPELPRFDDLPTLPELDPCPTGWTRTSSGPLGFCDPAAPIAGGCSNDDLVLPSAGCVSLDDACPAGDERWPVDLPASASVLYVREGAVGGSGTVSDPYGRLEDALAAGRAGTVIALSRGVHPAPDLRVDQPLTLWGVCPSATRVTGGLSITASATITQVTLEATVDVSGPAATLQVREARWVTPAGLSIHDRGRIDLRRTRIELGTPLEVFNESRAVIAESKLRETPIAVYDRSQIAVTDVHLAGDRELLSGSTGAALTVDRVVANGRGRARALSVSDGATGRVRWLLTRSASVAISVVRGGLEIEKARLEDSHWVGITAEVSTTTLTDVVIRRVSSGGHLTSGVLLVAPLHASVRRTWIEDVSGGGLWLINGPPTPLEVHDLVVLRSVTRSDALNRETRGFAFIAEDVNVTLRRALLEDSQDGGVSVKRQTDHSARFETHLEDVVVRRSHHGGVIQRDGTTLTGSRVAIVDTLGAGIFIEPGASDLNLTDLTIRGSRSPPDVCEVDERCTGAGIVSELSASGLPVSQQIARFRIEDNALAGVIVGAGLEVTLREGIIRGHPVGVRILPDAYSAARVLVGVRYEDNDRAIVRGIQ